MSTVIRSVKYGGLYSPAKAVAKKIAVIRLVKCGCIDSPAGSCENDHHDKISHKHRCLLSLSLLALCCSDFSMHAFLSPIRYLDHIMTSSHRHHVQVYIRASSLLRSPFQGGSYFHALRFRWSSVFTQACMHVDLNTERLHRNSHRSASQQSTQLAWA